MRGAFVQVQSALQQTFPGLEVEGGTYPIPAAKALAARAVQILQYLLMAVVMFGDHIFPVLGVRPPELYQQVKDKKFGVIMGVWLIGNMLNNSLKSTGAFEVYYNGQQVFSKLAADRFPTLPEVTQAVEALMPGRRA